MLRLYDSNHKDITGYREYCGNPSCLGEPWCSAWGICSAEQQEAELASGGGSGNSQQQEASLTSPLSANMEEEIDQLILELSQQQQQQQQQEEQVSIVSKIKH